jgi:hypothetical protein
MKDAQMKLEDFYGVVRGAMDELTLQNHHEIASELDNALKISTSVLEILGATRKVFLDHRQVIEKSLGSTGHDQVSRLIAFVNLAYGR